MNTISITGIIPHKPSVSVVIILGAIFLAVFFGLAAAMLPGSFVIILVLAPPLVVLSLAYPVIGLIFTLMVIFQIIPEQFHPRVPFGNGTLRIHDLMIIYLTGVVAIKRLANHQSLLTPLREFLLPLLYLFGCIFSSIIYVKIAAPNDRLLSEGRFFIAWMLLPLITLGITSDLGFRWFWRSVIGLASVM